MLGYLIIKFLYPSYIDHGPNSSQIKQLTYYDGESCYRFYPKAYICPLSVLKKI